MRRFFFDLLYGTILAGLAAGLSCLLALVGFGRAYYLAVFLPVSMLGCLLIAWLLYLRDDRFLGSPSALKAEKKAMADRPVPHAGDGAASAEGLFGVAALWDEPPLVRARPAGDEGGRFRPKAKRALLWAALELGLAATLLYSVWKIGATYF